MDRHSVLCNCPTTLASLTNRTTEMIHYSLEHRGGGRDQWFVNTKLGCDLLHQRPVIIFRHVEQTSVYLRNAYASLIAEPIAGKNESAHVAHNGTSQQTGESVWG